MRVMPRQDSPLREPVDAAGRLGAQMRQLRKRAGLALREAAALAACSPGHLSNVEHAKTFASEPLVLALDVQYRANGLLLSLYEELLGERRRREYRNALTRRGASFERLPEAGASEVWTPAQRAKLPLPGDASEFEGDVLAPIGVILERGSYFVKSWRLRNSGSVEWRDRFLQRVGPSAAATLVASESAVPISYTAPGDSVTVSVRCRAQWVESTSVAHFKMVFADGRLCWPDRYSHGVDLLVTSVRSGSCKCPGCTSVGPSPRQHDDGR
jgi:transcriptional regulator with XRE-family HTH domain